MRAFFFTEIIAMSLAWRHGMDKNLKEISTLLKNNSLNDARIKIFQYLDKNPKSSNIYSLAISLFVRLEDREKALNFADKGLSIFPNDSDLLSNKGRILLDFYHDKSCIDYFNAALKINPNKPQFFVNLIEAYSKYKNTQNLRLKIKEIFKRKIELSQRMQIKVTDIILQSDYEQEKNDILYGKVKKFDLNLVWDRYLRLQMCTLNEKEFINISNRAMDLKISEEIIDRNKGDFYFKVEKDFTQALLFYSKLIIKNNQDYETFNKIGLAFKNLGKIEAALESLKKSYEINKKYAPAIGNLSLLLIGNSQYQEAALLIEEAIKISPNEEAYYVNLATCYQELGNFRKSQECLKKSLEINPNNEQTQVFKIFNQACEADWSFYEDQSISISKLGTHGKGIAPYQMLILEDNPKSQFMRAKSYVENNYKGNFDYIPNSAFRKSKKIKIGLFSADFHDFPGMHLMIGLLENIDKTKFEITAYSYGPPRIDYMRERVINAVDRFVDIRSLSDREAAISARDDAIDIAIHRNGFTKNHRTGIFHYRPAPIQVNYLGHPSTLGANFMDYIIADKVIIPDEFKEFYSEKIIFMPGSYQPTNDQRFIPECKLSRADYGLPTDGIVLVCFNTVRKIGPEEFKIWMKLLRNSPKSVLWLLQSSTLAMGNLRGYASKYGVDPKRLVFTDRVSNSEHLARHAHADLFVDNFIYNAHTTASDALWAGVPLVTKLGKQFSARVASSLLNALGMPGLITRTSEEYEDCISQLMQNPTKLHYLKNTLSNKKLESDLFNTKKYTSFFELAMEEITRIYRSGKPPQDITF